MRNVWKCFTISPFSLPSLRSFTETTILSKPKNHSNPSSRFCFNEIVSFPKKLWLDEEELTNEYEKILLDLEGCENDALDSLEISRTQSYRERKGKISCLLMFGNFYH